MKGRRLINEDAFSFQKLPKRINGMLLLAISLDRQRKMISDEDLRKLGNGIIALVEKVGLLKEYAKVLSQDNSKFDSNQF